MIIDEELTYDRKRFSNEHELPIESLCVLKWIQEKKSVLELGCHTGHLSEWLQKNGCSVTGVDLNETALKIAEPFLDHKIFADLETNEFWNQIQGCSYNTITCMHVLEHLSNPWETLEKLTHHLLPNGEIIIALPNINNAKDRINILFGEFNYSVDGVMDQTHLRFFNQNTARELIEKSNLEIVEYFSPWKTNPCHHFVDHLPLLWRLKTLFKPQKVPFIFRNKPNLTDVVMMFRCRLK